MCMNKINYLYRDKKVGLPMIATGLANGDWNIIKKIITDKLKDVDVTIVKYHK